MALPGVYTTVKDRFYALSRTNIPVGTKIVVLGKRTTDNGTDGVQDLDPYNLQDEKAVVDAFGLGSDIHRAFLELLAAGAPRVTAVALPNDTVFDYTNGVLASDVFDNLYPDDDADLFDVAFAAVEAADPDIVIAYGRGSSPGEWNSPATPNLDPGDFDDDYGTYFGFYANNSATLGKSFATKIADKIALINTNTHPCIGIVGVKPFLGTAEGMTPGQVASHVGLTGLINKETIPANGIHLVVVQGELRPLGYPVEFGYANGACSLAGALAGLDSWSSPTAKPIYNVDRIRYNATSTAKEAVIAKGVVPIGLNVRRQPTWVDTMTFSKNGSDYTRLTTVRIVNDAINLVREVAQRFVGEASTLENRNALETAITGGLRGMQQAGALLASDFVITYDATRNSAIIDLILTPAFEIRTIDVRVSIQL